MTVGSFDHVISVIFWITSIVLLIGSHSVMGSHFAIQTDCCKIIGELFSNDSESHLITKPVVENWRGSKWSVEYILKVTPASSSRVRHKGERLPVAVLAPVSIWLIVFMLKPATYTSKMIAYMFMMIDESICIICITKNHSSCINWPQSFTCVTTFLALSDPSRRDV